MEAVEISRRLAQGPTVIKNERFTDLQPKPTTSKKVSPLHPNYTPQRPKELGAWGKRNAGGSLSPNSPEAREISHTLKYDRLKLPTTFFTDKYGQVQIQTDIYEQQVYRADVRPDKLLISRGKIQKMSFFLYFVAVNIGIELEKSLNADYISTGRIYSPQGVFSSVSVVPGEKMNYDLIMLAGKLRQVEKLDQLQEVKDLAETFVRREKNYALLTLMAVAEEFGEKEITDTLDKLRTHLSKCCCDRSGEPPLV